MQYKKFDTIVQIITASSLVDVFENCNAILFTNLGDTVITVDEKTLFPSTAPATVQGDSVSYGGNELEVYNKKSIKVSFIQPIGLLPRLEIVQKFYL